MFLLYFNVRMICLVLPIQRRKTDTDKYAAEPTRKKYSPRKCLTILSKWQFNQTSKFYNFSGHQRPGITSCAAEVQNGTTPTNEGRSQNSRKHRNLEIYKKIIIKNSKVLIKQHHQHPCLSSSGFSSYRIQVLYPPECSYKHNP